MGEQEAAAGAQATNNVLGSRNVFTSVDFTRPPNQSLTSSACSISRRLRHSKLASLNRPASIARDLHTQCTRALSCFARAPVVIMS